MNLIEDLANIIRRYFDERAIEYDPDTSPRDLAALYLKMSIRRISSTPRQVIFSDQIHSSLGELSREDDPDRQVRAREAWNTVFAIRHYLTEGKSVTRFLSRSVTSAAKPDGMLWDFGMHHFHLCSHVDRRGDFVERSDYLLFAVITDGTAYFVDVRRHQDSEGLGWVRQKLLCIAHANWPELIESHELFGAVGDRLTDRQKQRLRTLNANHVTRLAAKAIAPIGGGTTAAGGSVLCRFWADRLIHHIENHERYFGGKPQEMQRALTGLGVDVTEGMEFRLVRTTTLNHIPNLREALESDGCLSKELWQMGFAVVEATTGAPVAIRLVGSPGRLGADGEMS